MPQFPQYLPINAQPPGMLAPGNIDLTKRIGKPGDPITHNPNGSTSTVYSGSMTDQYGREVLVPFVIPNGKGKWKIATRQEAWDQYQKTGEHLGIFDHWANADQYAQYLHQYLASHMGLDQGQVPVAPMGDASLNSMMSSGAGAMGNLLKTPITLQDIRRRMLGQ